MSSRKPGYVIGVVVAAIILSLVPVIQGLETVFEIYSNRGRPRTAIRGISPLMHAAFWQDQFVSNYCRDMMRSADGGIYTWFRHVSAVTGEMSFVKAPIATCDDRLADAFGEKLFFVGANQAYEVIDGVVNNWAFPFVSLLDRQLLLWEGRPAFVVATRNGFEICALNEDVSQLGRDVWRSVGIVKIPEVEELLALSGSPIQFAGPRSIRICDSPEGTHLFVTADGRLFHHQGFEIDRDITSEPTTYSRVIEVAVYSPEPASALVPTNTAAAPAGWSLVREKQLPEILYPGQGQGFKYPGGREHSHGILIDGHPAAVIIDDAESNDPTARLYRLNGTSWTEVALQQLPFGSRLFRTVTTTDGQRSYLVIARSTDVNHVYAVEATGFRETIGARNSVNSPFDFLLPYAIGPVIGFVFGVLLSGVTALLMWRFTKPDYEFGVQSVKLAALGWRGFARLIDLCVICTTTLGLGWIMTRDLDLLIAYEAYNLKVDHPMIDNIERVAIILGVWLIASVILLLISQAVWGITPGKWLCRLKTVRTTLRPCGFASSLAREIVFFVDCCNFLCWTPGVMSIAFTDRRQRLGDFVADTIVVESRSLPNASTAKSRSRCGESAWANPKALHEIPAG